MNGTTDNYSRMWLSAIEQATACLNDRPQDGSNEIESCLRYLQKLEAQLRQQDEETWDEFPSHPPPKFKNNKTKQQNVEESSPCSVRLPNQEAVMEEHLSNNPFAELMDDYYYDDEEEGYEYDNDYEEEAGDYPVLNLPPSLVTRRLVIRILTAQSECLASQASEFRAARKWKRGAELLNISLQKIHEAIQLADSEISRLFSLNMRPAKELAEDANIVEVAIQFLTKERDSYLVEARQQEARLQLKLQPQWTSRDEAKARIGDYRWNHNPHPKNDYREKRKRDEQQLRDVQAALLCLQQVDTNKIQADSQQLQKRLTQTAKKEGRRYNEKRPTGELLVNRVSLQEYPDPTLFGWTFTGSWKLTEFFEMDGVKLDWYFTTATVKTSMDHPKKGKTQLFGAQVTPNVYREVLQNPRAHTNVRYHTKQQKQQNGSAFVADYAIETA